MSAQMLAAQSGGKNETAGKNHIVLFIIRIVQ